MVYCLLPLPLNFFLAESQGVTLVLPQKFLDNLQINWEKSTENSFPTLKTVIDLELNYWRVF